VRKRAEKWEEKSPYAARPTKQDRPQTLERPPYPLPSPPPNDTESEGASHRSGGEGGRGSLGFWVKAERAARCCGGRRAGSAVGRLGAELGLFFGRRTFSLGFGWAVAVALGQSYNNFPFLLCMGPDIGSAQRTRTYLTARKRPVKNGGQS